jgi:cellulose synthase/poly-beta-1,6-N-acetylglucosamine synthase-like glycosyltransferase
MGMGGAVRLDGLQEAAATVDAAAVVGGLSWALIAAPAIAFTALASLRSRAVRLRYSQRTRWIKGHLQTWLVLMRDPIRTAREMGLSAFGSMQLVFAGGLIAAFAHGPLAFIVLTAMLSPYDLLTTADFTLALSGYCVALFAALTASALSGNLSHARAALTMPLYWPLSTLAAFRAIWELTFRPHHWSKTQHGVSQRSRASR